MDADGKLKVTFYNTRALLSVWPAHPSLHMPYTYVYRRGCALCLIKKRFSVIARKISGGAPTVLIQQVVSGGHQSPVGLASTA